ncbi:MAG TPA: response regulator [Herpetosiphonaceae bacterium]|nr:response regulator [Herpetosiphonaceae bacterium]
MPRILVIDDDVAALSALVATLEANGYTVQRSSSTNQARHILDDAEPDLILLEVDTDRAAGWDLLRDIIRYQGPPTIVVTHRAREEEIVQALSIGAVDVLPKPFRSNELLARVRKRLGVPLAAAPPVQVLPPAAPPLRRVEDEPVFMPDADEQALITPVEVVAEALSADEEQLPIGPRLRTARQRRKLTLVQANLETKIPIWYLQAIEEEKFSLLPRGPAAAEMVRKYAAFLRLDSRRVEAEFQTFSDARPMQPPHSLGVPPERRPVPTWLAITTGALLALALGIGMIWYLVPNQVTALGDNLRSIVVQPAATVTAAPPAVATITPSPRRTPGAAVTPQP